ncbi:hypothetical protein HMPREF9373_1654 [Psychrobacter sp. 1501(2011)]|nr:hypothetical protein HMPREF9373_1654 [Psychrobacter sp. 1501(2011)]
MTSKWLFTERCIQKYIKIWHITTDIASNITVRQSNEILIFIKYRFIRLYNGWLFIN